MFRQKTTAQGTVLLQWKGEYQGKKCVKKIGRGGTIQNAADRDKVMWLLQHVDW